jgi:DNA ligase-1
VSELEVLNSISNVSGKNEKSAILELNKNNEKLAELLNIAFNYKRKFFLNKVSISKSESEFKCKHKEFIDLINKLEHREITGNNAKNTFNAFLNSCNEFQQLWYGRILKKDLKIGISSKTAAKYFKSIPVFEVMLAKDGKSCKQLDTMVSKGLYVSKKFDGYRCLAVVEGGSVTLYTRDGHIYSNFPKIEESLSKCFPKGNYVFDGEIMSDDFQSMQKSAFASKRGTTVGDPKFYIFDCVDYQEWTDLKFKQKTSTRLNNLNSLSSKFDSNLIRVEHKLSNNIDEILTLEALYLSEGFEGAMALPDIPYFLGKKSNKMLKFKTFKSQDCKILGFYEGRDDTRHLGSLGGVEVEQENGKKCEVGSGFSDEDRAYIWNNKSEFIDRLCEIKYQELTSHGIMRFPVFVRWRDLDNSTGKI